MTAFHKIRGHTLEEAYRKMRRRYGADAVVVRTATVSEGGILGFFGRKMIEVTASVPKAPGQQERPLTAAERKYRSQPPTMTGTDTIHFYEQLVRDAQHRMTGAAPVAAGSSPRPVGASSAPRAIDPRPREEAAGRGDSPTSFDTRATSPVLPFPKPRAQADPQQESLRREMQEIREMLQVLYSESPGAGLPAEFAPHYRALVERGVARKVAAQLIGAVVRDSDLQLLRDPRVFSERMRVEIRKRVYTTGGIALHGGERRIVALCGATGVGKTTNLAKLAAQYSVKERARVGLISADSYRIAASEQLRVYASIIGVPFHAVSDGDEMRAALDATRACDLVFIDTAGGSQFNLEQINELKTLLLAAQPHETLLVLSAPTQLDDLRNVVSNFKCVHPTSLMFTKLDETRQYGGLFSILAEAELPLAYVSTGQNVPDDIALAKPEIVANLLLERMDNRG
jgi:flagellar biosynthesis protein FlhF